MQPKSLAIFSIPLRPSTDRSFGGREIDSWHFLPFLNWCTYPPVLLVRFLVPPGTDRGDKEATGVRSLCLAVTTMMTSFITLWLMLEVNCFSPECICETSDTPASLLGISVLHFLVCIRCISLLTGTFF